MDTINMMNMYRESDDDGLGEDLDGRNCYSPNASLSACLVLLLVRA